MISVEQCADLLDDAPSSLALLQSWLRWRKGNLIPTASDVVAEDLRSAISGVSVLEVYSPERVIFRLFGSVHAGISGTELKGENLIDLTPPEEREARMSRIWNVASIPCGSVYAMKLTRESGMQTPVRGLVLPVAPRVSDAPMRAYATIDIMGEAAMPDGTTVDIVPGLDEQVYLDVGFGTPK